MLWVIQNNLYNEAGYVRFIDALEHLGMDYIVVKPVPFTNILLPADFDSMTQEVDDVDEPYIDGNQKVIVCGATSLSRISKAKGWTPGTYLNDNFDFEVWRDGFGKENILNGEAITGTISTVMGTNYDWVFVRPAGDTKSFNGVTMSKYDLQDWLLQMRVIEEEDDLVPLHKNTKIVVAPLKNILAEYRLFVVDGKVISGSLYKRGNTVMQSEDVDQCIIDFGQQMVDKWQPARAFVIDIADTDEGLKVIEINNINSAGFYATDVQKIIMALEKMEEG